MTTESRRTPDENVIGTVIGHYKVTAVLNQGGMGAVYRAEHPLIGKPAVIKLLLPDLSANEEMVRRFFNEAKAASAIRHPGIVEIFDFGYHTDGRAYIVMEFLDGQSLAERLEERARLPELDAAVITRSIAGALGAAHAKGIVHRDLKPDNIFLVPDGDMATGERAKVLDFGIAKLNSDAPAEVSRTRTGAVMGTPLYMAPEQCRGAGEVDARADLYSLGCLLYEMLCGQPPFLADGAGEIIAMQLFAEPVPPREIVPELSPEIEQIILDLLAKDASKRPQTARELMDRLGKLMPRLSSRLSAAVPIPTQTRTRPVVSTPRPVAPPMTPAKQPTPKPTTLGGSASHMIPSIPPDDFAPRRSKLPWIAVGAVVIGAVVAFVVVKSIGGKDRPAAATGSASAAPAPTPAGPPAPTTITLTLVTDPPDAAITIDGKPVALDHGALTLPRDGATHELVATAAGHATHTLSVVADKDQTLPIALAAEAPAPPPVAPPPVAPPPTPPVAPPPTPPVAAHGHPGHVRTPTTPPATTATHDHAGSGSAKPPKPPKPPTDDHKLPATSPNGSPIETNL